MNTPQSTPVKFSKSNITSTKSLPLTNEFKKLLNDQHQRLSLKHQQDLDLIDDIRSYVKARLSIEKDYTNALQKLAKNHSHHISKKFSLLHQLDQNDQQSPYADNGDNNKAQQQYQASKQLTSQILNNASGGSELQLATHNHNQHKPEKASSLYKVWSNHINCLQSTSKIRADQFEQTNLIVDKLKDIRQHKASIGKKCLDTQLKRIQEELLASMLDVDRAKKLYYEDESQAKKARENEERIKKKRSGLLTKFTDLQAKKEKSSAQREATDIQSTQARNDYIMALAAANAHLNYYYYRDLNDFINLIDDGVLDHCKIFMATLSECDINSLKDSLTHAQFWSKLINLTGSQQTNQIFLDCDQSKCLKEKQELQFEACNNDPIQKISLEHNADYALQHEIDKWFTWFKKECRNLSQLLHQLDTCQHALAEGKKSVEFNGQTIDDLEPKVLELKQQIRKSEAAKLRAQARLMVIKEGGMQIEEWSAVELEIRADMARAQEEQERAKRSRELKSCADDNDEPTEGARPLRGPDGSYNENQLGPNGGLQVAGTGLAASSSIHLQVSRNSDDEDIDENDDEDKDATGGLSRRHDDDDAATQIGVESMHNLASVSRSTSNLLQRQQQAISGYSALTDPSLVWQDDYSATWGSSGVGGASGGVPQQPVTTIKSPTSPRLVTNGPDTGYELLKAHAASGQQQDEQQLQKQQHIPSANMSIQSSSPLSAIVNGGQHLSQSPYQGAMSEAYKSDYECDYSRSGQHPIRSTASSVEPAIQQLQQQRLQENDEGCTETGLRSDVEIFRMLNKQVIAQYKFEKNNHDDLEFEENDLLVVIEINGEDPNWVKARHLTTGEEGYIPSSYMKLYEDERINAEVNPNDVGPVFDGSTSGWSPPPPPSSQSAVQSSTTCAQVDEEKDGPSYCRALYDYNPEENTFDEDGLPHLALTQGELIRIIDQGEDDGWWLVEKEDSGVRGHVPSMLVEEVEFDDNEESQGYDENEAIDDDDGDVSTVDEDEPAKPPPSFEAPILDPEASLVSDYPVGNNARQLQDVDEQVTEEGSSCIGNTNEQKHSFTAPTDTMISNATTTNSLLPKTSFIIIEPTPEVETKRFVDESFRNDNESNDDGLDSVQSLEDAGSQDQASRRIVQTKPPAASNVSYSVINENFVLEQPARKPNVNEALVKSDLDTVVSVISDENGNVVSFDADDKHEEGERRRSDGEMDFKFVANMPEPPSVVIDSVEAIPRSPDLSFDDGANDQVDSQSSGYRDSDGQNSESADQESRTPERKPIRHSGFVDVNPLLRHHAEEFARQLIEEAIMLAPGSQIGPSTSSAEIYEANACLEDEDSEFKDDNGTFENNHVGQSNNDGLSLDDESI